MDSSQDVLGEMKELEAKIDSLSNLLQSNPVMQSTLLGAQFKVMGSYRDILWDRLAEANVLGPRPYEYCCGVCFMVVKGSSCKCGVRGTVGPCCYSAEH